MKFRALAFDYHTEATNRLLIEEQNESNTSRRSKQATIWVLPPSSDAGSSEDEDELEASTAVQTEEALSSPTTSNCGENGKVPPITPGTSLPSPPCNANEPSFTMADKETTCLPPNDPKQGPNFLGSSNDGSSFYKTPLRSSKAAVVTDKKALPPSSSDEEKEETEDFDDGCSFMAGLDDDDPMTSVLESKYEPMDVDTNEVPTRDDQESFQTMDVCQSPKQNIDKSVPSGPSLAKTSALVPCVAQKTNDLGPQKKRAFFDLSQFPPELVLSALIRPIKNERRQVATRPYSASTGSDEQHPLFTTTSMRFLSPAWLRPISISFPRPPTNPMERLSVWSPVGTTNARKDGTCQPPLDAQTGAMVLYMGPGSRLTPKDEGRATQDALVPYSGGPPLTIPNEMLGALRVAIEIAQHCMRQQQQQPHSKAANAVATGSLSPPATIQPCMDAERAIKKNHNKRRKLEPKDAAVGGPTDQPTGMSGSSMAQYQVSMPQPSSQRQASPIPTRWSTNTGRSDVLSQDKTKSASKRKRTPSLVAVVERGDFPGGQPLRCEEETAQSQKKPTPTGNLQQPGPGRPANYPGTLHMKPQSMSRKQWTKMCATRHNSGDFDASDESAALFVAAEQEYRPSATQVQEDRTGEAKTPPTSNKRRAKEMESGEQLSGISGQDLSLVTEPQLPAGPNQNNSIIHEQDQGVSGDQQTAASHKNSDQSPAVSTAMNPFERVRTSSKHSEERQSAPGQGFATASGSSSGERPSASNQGRSIATRLKFSPYGAATDQPVGNEAILQLVGATEGRGAHHAIHHRSRESSGRAPMEKERAVPDKKARKEEKRRRKKERKEAKRKQKKERKEKAKRQKKDRLSSVKPSVEDSDSDDEIECLGVKPPVSSESTEELEQVSGHQRTLPQESFMPQQSTMRDDRAPDTKEGALASKTLEAQQNQRQFMAAVPQPIGHDPQPRFPSSRLGSTSRAMQESREESSNFEPRDMRTQKAPKCQEQENHPDSNNGLVFDCAEQSSSRLHSSSRAMQELRQEPSNFCMRAQTAQTGQEQRNGHGANSAQVFEARNRTGGTETAPISQVQKSLPKSLPVTNNTLVFGMSEQRPAPKATNKYASMPPLEIISSERFIDGSWAESLAELASGRWTLSLFRGENRQIAQPVPDSAVYGRKIVFRDTSLVDCTGVDIELPGGHAIVVHSISNWDKFTAREINKSILRLMSTERFSSLTCVLSIEREITQAQSMSILELLNSTSDSFGSSSFVQVHLTSFVSLSSSLARIILKHWHANDTSTKKYSEVLELLSNEEVCMRAFFLLRCLPTLSATQAMLMGEAEQFRRLFSHAERQKLPARMLGGRVSTNESKHLEKVMIQLSCVLKANLRELHR